ncbi:MAG: response regulator [Thermodesulfobacteriota bacterium]
MAPKKYILIIDDHPLYREGLKSIISRSKDYEVCGEAGTAAEGLQQCRSFQPDLLIIDISLPDRSGIELTREIRNVAENARVLIVSMHAAINYITEAFQAGATGYVVKESAHERLIEGLDTIARGRYFLDSSISQEVVQTLKGSSVHEARNQDTQYGRLTAREQEIMRLLAEGFKSREIGEMLCISPKTVENHRTNIMQKLGLHSTIELVRYAAKIGLIDVDLWKV